MTKASPLKGLPKQARVVSSLDFTAILRGNAFAADDVIVVSVRWNPTSETTAARLGISIPKKTGNAVVRNQWKRWIREAFRITRQRLPTGIDVIIRPKRDAVGSFQSISRSLRKTVERAVRKLPPRVAEKS